MLRAVILAAALLPLAAQEGGVKAPEGASYTDEEMAVVAEINRIRRFPRQYAEFLSWWAQVALSGDGMLLRLPSKDERDLPPSQWKARLPIRLQEGRAAILEAVKFLETVTPCPPLTVSDGLSKAAREHVRTQGPTGETGHTGPDGSRPAQRVERFGDYGEVTGEIINYGQEPPRYTVLQLVIDDGVANRSHRKAIFNCEYRVAGPAIGPHKTYGTMTVVELADRFTPKGEPPPKPTVASAPEPRRSTKNRKEP